MGPDVAAPINPYAPPQCAAGGPPPQALDLDEPILLRGEINLAHEVLVMRRWKDRPTKWIPRLFALLALCVAAFGFYRFWQTGDYKMLWAVGLPIVSAVFFAFLSWIILGLQFALLGLLGISYQKSFWAQATNEGLRTRGVAGEEFQPWSSFSRMELADELIFLYGRGEQRAIPIVIFNLHWCARSTDEERLLLLLEARFGPSTAKPSDTAPPQEPSQLPAAPHPTMAGEEPIVLAGLVDLDQLLRIERLKQQPWILTFVTIVFVLAVVVVGTQLWRSEPRLELWMAYGIPVTMLGPFYVACLFKSRIDAWLLRRSFEGGRMRPQWTTWTISTAGVSLLTEALETHEAWSQLRYCDEGENMLVLSNPASHRLHFLPREFATDQQWESLRQMVRANAVRNAP